MNSRGFPYRSTLMALLSFSAVGCFDPPEFTSGNTEDAVADTATADGTTGDASPDAVLTDTAGDATADATTADVPSPDAPLSDAVADAVADAAPPDSLTTPDAVATDAVEDAVPDAVEDAAPDAPLDVSPDTGPLVIPPGGGTIAFSLLDSAEVMLVQAKQGGDVTNLSAALDATFGPSFTPADDELSISHNGEWLLLLAERLNVACNGWACLIRVKRDLSEAIVVSPGGDPLHPENASAISGDGTTVAYSASGGDAGQDIFITRYTGGMWEPGQNVTAGLSQYGYKYGPVFDKTATNIVFNCADKPYYDTGTALCRTDATGDAGLLLHPVDNAQAAWNQNATLYHPYYAPNGTVLFTSDWLGYEQVFRYDLTGLSAPSQVASDGYDAGAACALPDGRIASAWWNHTTGSSANVALRVSDAAGDNVEVVWSGNQNVYFGSLGCGF